MTKYRSLHTPCPCLYFDIKSEVPATDLEPAAIKSDAFAMNNSRFSMESDAPAMDYNTSVMKSFVSETDKQPLAMRLYGGAMVAEPATTESEAPATKAGPDATGLNNNSMHAG